MPCGLENATGESGQADLAGRYTISPYLSRANGFSTFLEALEPAFGGVLGGIHRAVDPIEEGEARVVVT